MRYLEPKISKFSGGACPGPVRAHAAKNGAAEVLWSRSPCTQMADEEEGEGCLHNLPNCDSQRKAESHHSVEGRFVCVYLTRSSIFGILGSCFAKIWEESRGSGPPLKLMTFYNRAPTMKTRL